LAGERRQQSLNELRFSLSHFRPRHTSLKRTGPEIATRLRVKMPKHNIVPLSVNEVARFWSSFRTSRDLAIVGLMLPRNTFRLVRGPTRIRTSPIPIVSAMI
jgi:hypothetical protein